MGRTSHIARHGVVQTVSPFRLSLAAIHIRCSRTMDDQVRFDLADHHFGQFRAGQVGSNHPYAHEGKRMLMENAMNFELTSIIAGEIPA
jgi:hypothetical protein